MQTLTGPVAIYARFSSALQSEPSVEDQVRRCREYVAQHGSDPEAVKVFADFAISGASLERPGFEAMLAAVNKGTIKVIVTEDLSRISRDFADSAMIFKKLQLQAGPAHRHRRRHRHLHGGREDGVQVDERGDVLGNKIEIHEAEAKIIRRVFRESQDGRSLTTIAHGLNNDASPSPRVGTRPRSSVGARPRSARSSTTSATSACGSSRSASG